MTCRLPFWQARRLHHNLFRARADQPLYVHTGFRVREISMTTKAADGKAEIRRPGMGLPEQMTYCTPKRRG